MAVSIGPYAYWTQIFMFNIVAIDSYLSTPSSGPSFTEQDITMTWAWNSMKDIEITSVSPQVLTVTGFVDTWINAAAENNDHTISINDVKRGEVALGDGNDTLLINVASNEYTWSNEFNVSIGNGNDTVSVQPEAYSVLANLAAPAGWTFNTAPQLTNADITVGNGNDTVALYEVSGTIQVGSGTDTIHVTDGNSTLWLGTGSDTVTISARNLTVPAPWACDTQVGSSTVNVGSGHADITIDDTTPALTPRTTLNFIHGETGGSTLATADAVHVGHVDTASGSFVAGDLTALVIDLAG